MAPYPITCWARINIVGKHVKLFLWCSQLLACLCASSFPFNSAQQQSAYIQAHVYTTSIRPPTTEIQDCYQFALFASIFKNKTLADKVEVPFDFLNSISCSA